MHFTGTIWRPPYEAGSALLQVTVGCTHHKCRFCSLYKDPFSLSPMSEIREDIDLGQDQIGKAIHLDGLLADD